MGNFYIISNLPLFLEALESWGIACNGYSRGSLGLRQMLRMGCSLRDFIFHQVGFFLQLVLSYQCPKAELISKSCREFLFLPLTKAQVICYFTVTTLGKITFIYFWSTASSKTVTYKRFNTEHLKTVLQCRQRNCRHNLLNAFECKELSEKCPVWGWNVGLYMVCKWCW